MSAPGLTINPGVTINAGVTLNVFNSGSSLSFSLGSTDFTNTNSGNGITPNGNTGFTTTGQ